MTTRVESVKRDRTQVIVRGIDEFWDWLIESGRTPTPLAVQVMKNDRARTRAIFAPTGKRWDREHMTAMVNKRWRKSA